MAKNNRNFNVTPFDADENVISKVRAQVAERMYRMSFGLNPVLVVFRDGTLKYNIKGRELLSFLKKEFARGNFPAEIYNLGDKKSFKKKRLLGLIAILEENIEVDKANA